MAVVEFVSRFVKVTARLMVTYVRISSACPADLNPGTFLTRTLRTILEVIVSLGGRRILSHSGTQTGTYLEPQTKGLPKRDPCPVFMDLSTLLHSQRVQWKKTKMAMIPQRAAA